ncbi:histidine kinase [Sorangium sp. So ce1036]|uniref:histidine kinase n=1 Tax=Sorangium sp. So ce1036 TaxID=3133328 RepID=UPI003F0633B6
MAEKALPESVYKLFARTGHDVRGPAGVVSGALDELEQALDGETTARNAAFFTMARRGVRRLLRLADRYTVASELARQMDAPVQLLDVEALVRQAVAEASFVYGRRQVTVALDLAPLRGFAHPSSMTAALADALMLALRAARSRVAVELGAHGEVARVVVTSDSDTASVEELFEAALSPGADPLDEGALPVRVIDGVLRAHGGAARVERAGAETRITLEWPLSEAARKAGGAR